MSYSPFNKNDKYYGLKKRNKDGTINAKWKEVHWHEYPKQKNDKSFKYCHSIGAVISDFEDIDNDIN